MKRLICWVRGHDWLLVCQYPIMGDDSKFHEMVWTTSGPMRAVADRCERCGQRRDRITRAD